MIGLPSIGGSLSGIAVFHNTVTILIGSDQSSLVDVTAMFPPMQMILIHFTDPISFEADTLELTFADIGDKIIRNKSIQKGKWIKVKIDQWNRDYPGSHVQKDLGSFMIDNIKNHWPPSQTTIMGSSVPIDQQIKLTLQNKTWQITDLKSLAQAVAAENNLGFLWDVHSNKNIVMNEAQQWNESNLQMLSDKLRSNALAFKIKDINGKQTLIVFDEQELEMKPPVYTINFALPGAGIQLEHGELTTQSQDIYSQSVLSYYDPNSDTLIVAAAQAPPENPSGSAEVHNSYYQEQQKSELATKDD